MKTRMLAIIASCFTIMAFADQPISPTKASEPLPTISKTKNIDTVITEKVQAAITKNAALKGQAVSAACRDGKVTLQGSVQNKNQETEAIKTAKSIPGVIEVESQLTIRGGK